MQRAAGLVPLALIAVLISAAGCTATDDAERESPPRFSYTPETRQVQVEGNTLAMTVEPLVRSGSTVVLTVRTSITANKGEPGPLVASAFFSRPISNAFDAGRLVDADNGKVWATATRAGDDSACVCTGLMRLEPGETKPLQAAFANVPDSTSALSVMLPWAGVFEQVPIVGGEVPSPPPGQDKAGMRHPPLDLADVGAPVTGELESFTQSLDAALTTRTTPASVDLTLDADVLFSLDSAELTPAAATSVAAADAEIRRAGPALLAVTGHTDNSGTTAHNQDLSRRRAETVAAQLSTGGKVTVTGKGESEPLVPNTTATNRHLNRRVTISYTRNDNPAAPSPTTSAGLPDTTGVRGTGTEGVTVTLPGGHGTVTFEPRKVNVIGPTLQIDLVAHNTGTTDADLDRYLGTDLYSNRGEFDPQSMFSTAGIRVISGNTAYYGLDYKLPSGTTTCLCDRATSRRFPPDSERVLSLWFPRPPGANTITLDVPDAFRLTDVTIG